METKRQWITEFDPCTVPADFEPGDKVISVTGVKGRVAMFNAATIKINVRGVGKHRVTATFKPSELRHRDSQMGVKPFHQSHKPVALADCTPVYSTFDLGFELKPGETI